MLRYPFLRTILLIIFTVIALLLSVMLWQYLPINDFLIKLVIGVSASTLLLLICECILPLDYAFIFERLMPIAIIGYVAFTLIESEHGHWIFGSVALGLIFPVLDALFYPQYVEHREKNHWLGRLIVRWLVSLILSISLTLPALELMRLSITEINLATIFSLVIGIIGLLVLIISTLQRSIYNHNKDNQYTINNRGLWHVSRHPNIWGEMMLWWGIFLIMLSLNGALWLLLLGPLALFLINQYYRIPKLEKEWIENNSQYVLYQQKTNLLFPFSKLNKH